MTAFHYAGFLLRRLSDLGGNHELRTKLGTHERSMPFVIVLEFVKAKGHTLLSENAAWQ